MSVTRNALSGKSVGGMSNGQRSPRNNHRKWPSSMELELASQQSQIQELQARIRWFEEERDRTSWVFEALPVGYVLLDEDGNIKGFNRELEKMLGFKHGVLAHGPMARLIFQPDLPAFLEHL